MMPNSHEMLYTTAVLVGDMNRHHRDAMMRDAEHARLVKTMREGRDTLARTVMTWTGRRLVASGHYLLSRAATEANDLSLASVEQN